MLLHHQKQTDQQSGKNILDVTKLQIRPKLQVDVQHPVMVTFELAVYVLVTDCGIFELMDPVCAVSQWTCQTVQNNF